MRATDAVVALAEAIAGTEENFVVMMNKRAKDMGLKDTNFKNCHGLDEEGHYSSAYDMAFIARELVKHEKILEYSSIYETYLREGTSKKIWLVNTNKIVFTFCNNYKGGIIISRNTQIEIMKFFLNTSIPRIIDKNRTNS